MKPLTKKLDTLSTRIWQESIRIEKMKSLADDHLAACECLNIPYDCEWERLSAAHKSAVDKLRKLSWDLATIQGSIEEAAWLVDEIVDSMSEF